MINKLTINISTKTFGLELRSANYEHLDLLRDWKNSQKEYFFHQKEISNIEQLRWFDSYINRNDDYMFMVVYKNIFIGCMGIRLFDENWDIYNVILGLNEYGGKGFMGVAFEAMLQWAIERKKNPITLKVLKHNPAVSWYKKQGLIIVQSHDSYYSMKYN